MAATVFYPHAIDLPNGDLLTQLTNVTPAYNFQDVVEFSSGDTAPLWSGTLGAAPSCAFSTRQCKSILDLCDPLTLPSQGKVVAYDGHAGSIDVWLRKGEAFGLRTADATVEHERARLTEGFLEWTTITASQNQVAEISCRLVAAYDGTNDPMVITQQALTGITRAVNHLFTLGPVTLNGSALAGLQGWTLSNNSNLEVIFDSGVPFPRYIGVNNYSPTLMCRVRDGTLMRTIGTRTTAITSLVFYLRKLQASAICVADASAEHISFSCTAGTVKARQVDNTGLVDVFMQLQRPTAAVEPYIFDTTSTIV